MIKLEVSIDEMHEGIVVAVGFSARPLTDYYEAYGKLLADALRNENIALRGMYFSLGNWESRPNMTQSLFQPKATGHILLHSKSPEG